MLFSTYVPGNWGWLLVELGGIYMAFFIFKFIKHRRFYNELPTPPHSMFWGNLKTMGEAMKRYPADLHPQPLFTEMGWENNLRGLFYVDLYPFSESMLFITDPAVALQTQISPNFDRHPFVDTFIGPIVGSKSIFSTHGAEWTRQRKWFTPAFSLSHLLTLVSGMIEESLVFREKLTKFAVEGEVFSMNDATMRLAIDFIGRTVGDIRLKSQTEYSSVQEKFMKAIEWTAGHTDPLWKRILSPFFMRYYSAKVDRELGGIIKEKYRLKKEDGVDKSILDLALKGYRKDSWSTGTSKVVRADLDDEFMKIALDNAKTFFVGGHDTTASLMTYMFYYLSINPIYLARIRAEHDSVFSTSLESAIELLTTTPALLNKLPLTSALIKEVLRLHPVGFTIRKGSPGSTVTFEGRSYPADNHIVCVLTSAMHYDSKIWDRPHEFDPDRFLGPETHSVEAWQPFEKGPRNCIGQQMATLEARVVAVLTVRFFDFEAVFKEHGLSIPGFGGRAYQELKLTAKPKDGIPMRAHLRKN